MSNVRSRQTHWVYALRWIPVEGRCLSLGRRQAQFNGLRLASRKSSNRTPARARIATWAARPLAVGSLPVQLVTPQEQHKVFGPSTERAVVGAVPVNVSCLHFLVWAGASIALRCCALRHASRKLEQ